MTVRHNHRRFGGFKQPAAGIAGVILGILTASPAGAAGEFQKCMQCHSVGSTVSVFVAGGSVFADYSAATRTVNPAITLLDSTGASVKMPFSRDNGDFWAHAGELPEGIYRPSIGQVSSRSWHPLPLRADCNACHVPGGTNQPYVANRKSMPRTHPILTVANACTPCHTDVRLLKNIKTPGTLNLNAPPFAPVSVAVERTAATLRHTGPRAGIRISGLAGMSAGASHTLSGRALTPQASSSHRTFSATADVSAGDRGSSH